MPIVEIKELRRLLPPKSRLMGLDHGEKTLGLALSNPEMTVITPFKTLVRKNFTENMKELAAVCKEYEVRGFVLGLPLNMDGTVGPRAQSVKTFAASLIKAKDALGFDPLIAFFDERLSTFAAEDLLITDLAMKRKKRKTVIDAHAAAHILKEALKAT